MKKSSLFFTTIVAIALLSGCAKERDNYDKYLTDGTWTMNSVAVQGNSVEVRDYVVVGTPTKTTTEENSETAVDGKSTNIDFKQISYSPGVTTFTRKTERGTITASFKFNKDGTYERSSTSQKLSKQNDTEVATGTVTNLSESVKTEFQTGQWSWGNRTQTKQAIYLDGMAFNLSISKSNLELSLNIASTSSDADSDGTGDYLETRTYNQSVSYKLVK